MNIFYEAVRIEKLTEKSIKFNVKVEFVEFFSLTIKFTHRKYIKLLKEQVWSFMCGF